MERRVRKIHYLVGYLQKEALLYLYVGAGIMLLMRVMHIYPSFEEFRSFMMYPSMVSLLTLRIACVIFYTSEKYDEYMKAGSLGRGIRIPDPDTFFYSTMIQDISVVRKIAGYCYAISKVLVFCSFGAILVFGFFIIFTKQ